MTSPGMISTDRSSQWLMNFGQPPGSPSNTAQTEAEEGAVGQLLEATEAT
jgi:hypothetical protein